MQFKIGQDIDDATMASYAEYVHAMEFPPARPGKVKESVGDGSVKVRVGTAEPTPRRVGRPRA
eukprot:9975279-Alexandrium_andersonii.AAC.1